MCARFSASVSRYCVRRTMTSTWCAIHSTMNCSIGSVRGTPSTIASMFAPNVVCSCVCL